MTGSLNIVILGLSLSSSWGNGHATTYRALIRGLSVQGHRVWFLERDMPWYASHRDLPNPDFCQLIHYNDIDEMIEIHAGLIKAADAVIVGSYVPSGVTVIDRIAALQPQRLCFYDIDTPVTLAKLARGDEEYLARRQIPLFDSYFSFSGGDALGRIERDYGARKALALYCSVDASRYRATGEAFRWDLGYLGTYSPDRQATLERLLIEPARRLPHLSFAVAGPQYPEDIVWPSNVERIEHLPPADHASFYSRQRFTLNVTRSDMIAAGWSPSVRLFEAAACGTPIVSDDWRGLNDFFAEGQAIIIARRSDDVVKALTTIPAADRFTLASAARATVMQGHTGERRAYEFAAALQGLPEAGIRPTPQPISA
ncbi:spore maturation protein CgeB [Rhizobium sp. BK529]|uniref:CgeB family protein n=1 Tax=unclassified Rhizobium TaxID=2613769 RepID=UPI001045FE4F|nr:MULTISPECIES: glycosyltransferase [unclassified Rhizobium]MBB3593110.1 spore maturation protein CgeB [Rhizobium sp. BK529]TCS07489.1 spore maturation protein CgeB [Rhizobium sp. BK418]